MLKTINSKVFWGKRECDMLNMRGEWILWG